RPGVAAAGGGVPRPGGGAGGRSTTAGGRVPGFPRSRRVHRGPAVRDRVPERVPDRPGGWAGGGHDTGPDLPRRRRNGPPGGHRDAALRPAAGRHRHRGAAPVEDAPGAGGGGTPGLRLRPGLPAAGRSLARHPTGGGGLMLRVGIDVGGTNTDAVLMEGDRVVAKVKVPGTDDLTTGITRALDLVLQEAGASPGQVAAVMIGTTHFINAILERKELAPAAAVRLGLPAGDALPPMVDWPADLREAVGDAAWMVHGGREFDGRPLSPLDPEEIRQVARQIGQRGIRAVALSSVFAPVHAGDEEQAAAIIRQVLSDADITLSSEIGRMGLLERENAGVLNAALRPLAARTIRAFRRTLEGRGVGARLYLTQNDGTLMKAEFAERYPVLTFASGPTNSMRGAAYLSGLRDGIVVDIGGTSTDVGALVQGFPREASAAVEVGGVRTNFRMPDIWSVALGGGTVLRADPPAVGPASVGRRITREALVFGG